MRRGGRGREREKPHIHGSHLEEVILIILILQLVIVPF